MIRLVKSLQPITNAQLRTKWAELGPAQRKMIQKEWRRITRRYPNHVCQEWKDGANGFDGAMIFFRDVGHRPSMSHRVSRHDNTMPFERSNAYWSVIGRRLARIIVAGQDIPLSDAALLADVNEASIVSRARKLSIECCILTPKSCRYPYPHDRAVEFLSRLDLLSYAALDVVEAERNRWGKKNPSKSELGKKAKEDQWHSLIHSKAATEIDKVLSIPMPKSDRIRLLAYYSMPSSIRQTTARILKNMIKRCVDVSNESYSLYGGRGIRVCRTWIRGAGGLSGLQCFVADMGCWQPGMEVDRIDPDGNYEMSNCRWVTRKQNINNIFSWDDVRQRLVDIEKAVDWQPKLTPADLIKAQRDPAWSATDGVYRNMLDRCCNNTNSAYGYYGGRGIAVCERWLRGDGTHSGLGCFVMDVGLQPPGMQLDRIDNDGHYEPANCRWLSPEDNKRNSWRLAHLIDRLDAMMAAKANASQRSMKRAMACKAAGRD